MNAVLTRVKAGLAALAFGFAASAAAQPCDAPYPFEGKDPALQASLERRLRAAGFGEALDRRRLVVAVVDLTHRGQPIYAGIHDDHMLYAASLPKLGILLAVIESIQRGEIEWGPEFNYRLRRMITISDNEFASWGFDLVGPRGIASVLRDPRYCLYESRHGGLWVGRPFRKDAASYRDPLRNLSHGATARQTARFYVLLDAGKLVSKHWSARMLRGMAPPEYHHKFVAGLAGRRLTFVARKSGTWHDFHSDSALVEHGSRRYVLAGLADHPDGENMLRELARIVDDLVMEGDHRRWMR